MSWTYNLFDINGSIEMNRFHRLIYKSSQVSYNTRSFLLICEKNYFEVYTGSRGRSSLASKR